MYKIHENIENVEKCTNLCETDKMEMEFWYNYSHHCSVGGLTFSTVYAFFLLVLLLISPLLFYYTQATSTQPIVQKRLRATDYTHPTTHNRVHVTEYTEPTTPNRLYTQKRLHTTDCTQTSTHNGLHTTDHTQSTTQSRLHDRLLIPTATDYTQTTTQAAKGGKPSTEMFPMFIFSARSYTPCARNDHHCTHSRLNGS